MQDNDQMKRLSPQQRGAAITNSGKSPIAGLSESARKDLLDHVLDRAMEDERLADIAADIGVSMTGLCQALLRHREDDWKSVQVARALVTLDRAENNLECAGDAVAVARAREEARLAQWKLERLCRRIYGEDHSGQSNQVVIQIGISRDTPHTQVIDT